MNHRDISKLESLYRSVIINEAQDTLQQRIADVKALIDKGTIMSRNEVIEQFDGIPGANPEQIADELLGDKGPQFDRTNSYGLYLVGTNDGFRRRPFNPRWFPGGREAFSRAIATGERVVKTPETNLSKEEIAEYAAGYKDGEDEPYSDRWDS